MNNTRCHQSHIDWVFVHCQEKVQTKGTKKTKGTNFLFGFGERYKKLGDRQIVSATKSDVIKITSFALANKLFR